MTLPELSVSGGAGGTSAELVDLELLARRSADDAAGYAAIDGRAHAILLDGDVLASAVLDPVGMVRFAEALLESPGRPARPDPAHGADGAARRCCARRRVVPGSRPGPARPDHDSIRFVVGFGWARRRWALALGAAGIERGAARLQAGLGRAAPARPRAGRACRRLARPDRRPPAGPARVTDPPRRPGWSAARRTAARWSPRSV